MAASDGDDGRVGVGMERIRVWAWVLLALLATIGAGGWLLVTDLLWTVPAPWLVLAVVLAVTAAPGLVPARRHRENRWAPVVTYLVAGVVGIGVLALLEPSPQRLVGVLAEVPAPADAGPIRSTGCRFCLTLVGSPPRPQASREVATSDPERVCQEAVTQARRAGWALREKQDDSCSAYLTRPAPFGRYGLTVIAYGPVPGNGSPGGAGSGPRVSMAVTADSSR